MPVATVVGGTPKLFTMPPSATGREATLKDMIIWPSAMAIIGTHDACVSARMSAIEIGALPWRPPLLGSGLVVSARPAPARLASASGFRFRDEQIHSQPLRQEFCGKLALDAVARGVERRREGAESALAGRNGDDAAADAALARQADVVEPVARRLVQSGG